MGGRKTFAVHDPVVEVVATSHRQRWYNIHVAGPDRSQWFWSNVVDDAFALTSGSFDDPWNRWVLYIDAENEPGQAVGGTSGVALLPRHDLLGLAGRNVFPGEDDVCRWVGGLGHELGHALGLPHPPGCEHIASAAACRSLMAHGFRQYPDTFLLPEDVARLDASPFFTPVELAIAPFPCSKLA